jgi:hypothetical protein
MTESYARWLDVFVLLISAVVLLPIVIVGLVPVILTLGLFWPLVAVPVWALQASVPSADKADEAQRPQSVRGRSAEALP